VRFKHLTDSVVNVDPETAAVLGPGWEPLDDDAKKWQSERVRVAREQEKEAAQAAEAEAPADAEEKPARRRAS
jgi:hypothetical protein